MYSNPIITPAIMAGKMENKHQIICFTDSISVMVITVSPVVGSVPDTKPEKPSNIATKEPLIAVPNFWAMVPLLKIRPVEEVPFFSVA